MTDPQPTYLDPDGKLAVMRAGDITLIARQLMPVTRLDGTNVLVLGGPDVLDDLREWARAERVDDTQKALGVGWGTASRLRAALGLATNYPRQSRTTKWRQRKTEP